MKKIENYNLPPHLNTLHKQEASSVIELAREVANKINELVKAYNDFSDNDLAWKQNQEGIIRKGVLYMKDNLINSLNDLLNLYVNEKVVGGLVENYITGEFNDIRNKTNHIATPEMFGGSVNSFDNHDSIIKALEHLKANGGGILLFNTGTYKTSPINFKGYRNIIITGSAPAKPWIESSCLKFISNGEVGLQFSEQSGEGYTNEVPTWNAINMFVNNIRIDCDNKVKIGINCNYDIHLYDVTVDNASGNGIVFEPQCYPVSLEKVIVRYSGENGLYIKAPYSTVYTIRDSQFDNNNGYGMYIEDGNTSIFENVIMQGNKRGGMKIELKNPSLYTHGVFLGNLTFINLYTEANGTLATSHPDYDGNHALYITGYDKTPLLNLNKIHGLTFINCNFNKSAAGSKGLIESVAYPFTDIASNLDSIIDTSKCGTLFAYKDVSSILDLIDNGHNDNKVHERPLFDSEKGIVSFVGDGYIGKRGRMRELHFNLDNSSITAGQTVQMNTVNPVKYYPILQTGTLYGINILSPVKLTSGTLTFKIKYGYKNSASGGTGTDLAIEETFVIDSTKNNISKNFPLLKYRVDGSFIIGIEVTASADYSIAQSGYSSLICELFIES